MARRPGSGGGTTVIVPGGGYYPWGWGGLGFGGYYAGYYGGLYDSWGYDPYQGGGYPSGGYGGYDEGSLRIRVKPREASVYIDGYFAGQVDDFDGVFQRLHIDSGPHRVEIRADGYEPLTFEINIQPSRTVTYKGELQKLP